MGALQRGTLCRERSPKGAHGGLWGDARCGNPRPRRETMQSLLLLGQNCSAFRICLKCYSLLCPTAGEADCHVASLLAMTCRRLLPVRIAPGYCRKAPLPRRRVSVFSMSLHAGWLLSAHLASFQHVIANQCAHWCGNPHPRRSRRQCTVLWANSQRLSYSP